LLNAFKNGLTILDENNLNQLLAGVQPFQVIYQGVEQVACTGSGVTENSIAEYSYCARFTLPGTEISRVELEIDRDGLGADLVVQLRSSMNPTAGMDGTLLKQAIVPKEFIPDPKAWWSIPIGLSGLTSDTWYWIVLAKAGDSVNKIDWMGEASPDDTYPAYRRVGGDGNWTPTNALHFRVFSGASGTPRHTIEGQNAVTSITYNAEGMPEKIYQYIPPADGPVGGVRDALAITYRDGLPVRGE
jgi:hypothetical protein